MIEIYSKIQIYPESNWHDKEICTSIRKAAKQFNKKHMMKNMATGSDITLVNCKYTCHGWTCTHCLWHKSRGAARGFVRT